MLLFAALGRAISGGQGLRGSFGIWVSRVIITVSRAARWIDGVGGVREESGSHGRFVGGWRIHDGM